MWEHINWLHGNYPIVAVEHLEVACLCGWIAAYIDNTVGGSAQDGLYYIRMHTGTRRVGNDDVGSSVFADELIIKHILHVTGEEQGVVDGVDLGIHLRIFDGLRHIFNANHLAGLAGHEVGYGARAGVEIIDKR